MNKAKKKRLQRTFTVALKEAELQEGENICKRCKRDLREEWESEKKEYKELGKLLIALSGFVIGGLWVLSIVGFFGGEKKEVYDQDVGELVVRFFLDEKVYLIVIGSWLLFGLIVIFLYSKNRSR